MSGRIRQSFKFEPKARDCMSDTTQPRMLYFTCETYEDFNSYVLRNPTSQARYKDPGLRGYKKSGLPRGGGGYNRAI